MLVSTLEDAYHVVYQEIWNAKNLEKRKLLYPDEYRIVFGNPIPDNIATASHALDTAELNPTVSLKNQADFAAVATENSEYIRYYTAYTSTEDVTKSWTTYLIGNPINAVNSDTQEIDASDLRAFCEDLVDGRFRRFSGYLNTEFTVQPVTPYRHVQEQRLDIFSPVQRKNPVISDDRYATRLSITKEIVNLEHEMVQTGSKDTTEVLQLHEMLVKQPPLCTDEYPCQCYKTYISKEKAIADCADTCDGNPFRHFWDQTVPRLTSKILVHDRSECVCMEDVKSELECVLAGRQFINELFVSQYDVKPPKTSASRDVRSMTTYLYCAAMECTEGPVNTPCTYGDNGNVCKKGWYTNIGGCVESDTLCSGFLYESCMCGESECASGNYCTRNGSCLRAVPKNAKMLLHLHYINNF